MNEVDKITLVMHKIATILEDSKTLKTKLANYLITSGIKPDVCSELLRGVKIPTSAFIVRLCPYGL